MKSLPISQQRITYVQAREEAKAKMGLAEVPEKSLTVPRPFNLTKPSLRKVQEPMKIEQVNQESKKKGQMGTISFPKYLFPPFRPSAPPPLHPSHVLLTPAAPCSQPRVPSSAPNRKAVLVGPSTDRLYRTNLAEVESGKTERLEEQRRQTIEKYREMEEAGKGMFRLHETRNTLDALREEVVVGERNTARLVASFWWD